MKKETISYCLILLMLLQSCVVYQKAPVPLSEAYDRGKAKVISKSGDKTYFKNISLTDSLYYGHYKERLRNDDGIDDGIDVLGPYNARPRNDEGKYEYVEKAILINTDQTSEVYLREPQLLIVWLKLHGKGDNHMGALYELKDSSIVVSSSLNNEDYAIGNFEISEYKISDITTIKFRRQKSVGKGAGIGALVGGGIGFFAGFIVGLNDFDSSVGLLFGGVTGAVGIAVGGLVGAIIGSNKVELPLNGRIENYNQNKYLLKQYAIIK